jgi:hypothetical protein
MFMMHVSSVHAHNHSCRGLRLSAGQMNHVLLPHSQPAKPNETESLIIMEVFLLSQLYAIISWTRCGSEQGPTSVFQTCSNFIHMRFKCNDPPPAESDERDRQTSNLAIVNGILSFRIVVLRAYFV